MDDADKEFSQEPYDEGPDEDVLSDLDQQLLSLGLRSMIAPDDPEKRLLPEYEHFWFFHRITPVLCLTREDVVIINQKLPVPLSELVWDYAESAISTTVIDLGPLDTAAILQLKASDYLELDLARIAGEAARAAMELCRRAGDDVPSPQMVRRLTMLLMWFLSEQYFNKIQQIGQQKDWTVSHPEHAEQNDPEE